MAKGKFKKHQPQQQQDFNKKKKNIITQQLLMDKSNMDFTQFIPLLPQDVYYPPYKINQPSRQAILKILTDLNYLLYLPAKNFWATVTYNISFARCISSCLSQFSVQWMNNYKFLQEEQNLQDFQYRLVKNQQVYQYVQTLQFILIKVIYRIMAFQEQDPKLNQIYNFGQNTINKQNIFSMPKLLEFIQIYSQSNEQLVRIISKNYIKTIPNVYKYFTELLLPHLIKKIQQNNRDMKVLIDRQQFGINYSYKRPNKNTLSPGQEQVKRKIQILMNYISFMKTIKNTRFLTQQIYDHCFFNYQINFILQNCFYQLDACYKIWNYQGVEKRILPLINNILAQIIDYFVIYFNRVNQRLVQRNVKSNTIQAYIRSLQRFFIDYGKRTSLGKRGNTIRNLTLFKLITKKFKLVEMLQAIYNDEMQNKTYQFNLEYLVDFKLALEDSIKEDKLCQGYVNQNDHQMQEEMQDQTQFTDAKNINDFQDLDENNLNNQDQENQKQTQQLKQKLQYSAPKQQQKLQFLVSKKSYTDDYYEQLYMKQKKHFKIQYQDQYDDLVDYDKRPLFMDQQSSDSDSQQQQKKHLVNNLQNQKINQIKHLKYQQKIREKKQGNNNNKKYSKVTQNQKKEELLKYKQKYIQKQDQSKKQTQTDKQKQKKKYKQKNTLNQLIQKQDIQNQQGLQNQENEENQRGQSGRGGRGGYKKKYHPNPSKYDAQNDKFRQKGGNKNKNKEYGNQLNKDFGGGKKYREKY